jgi:adenylate cyclase
MKDDANGELVPVGGGDTIPLLRPHMTVGRRESCDIPLQFPNISGVHCELTFRDGYWSIKDLNSTNGVKVNGMRVQARPLKPGDEVAIAKRRFTIQYVLTAEAQHELEALLTEDENIFGKSLLEKAGLSNGNPAEGRRGPGAGPMPKRRPGQGERIELTELDD